mgnify:CR=1 FL=1
MLLKRRFLDGIAGGSISLVFRRWRKPTVKAGGTLKTAVGVLAIDEVESTPLSKVTAGWRTISAGASPPRLMAAM